MTDNNRDRRYIHELALDVLEKTTHVISGVSWPCPETDCSAIPDCLGRKVIDPWTLAFGAWGSANCPLLTEQASAVLEEVEEAMKYCKDCKEICGHCDCEDHASLCKLSGIRRAYEKGKRHED